MSRRFFNCKEALPTFGERIERRSKPFRFVRTVCGNTVPVIHGSLDSKLGRINNKLFLELQRCSNDL